MSLFYNSIINIIELKTTPSNNSISLLFCLCHMHYTLLLFPVERNHYNPHFVLNKINMYFYDRLAQSKSLQTMQAKQINEKICV